MPNLVGIGLSQVPTNSMLGGLAYQSPDHASIKDLDLKNLSQINSEIAGTAVDIFIYDTSKDSDGGAWRKRTTHTSWYNETLNTATRGSRREFPAVAVIVASTSPNRITIYDGDDPDLPMWMVFTSNVNQYGAIFNNRSVISVVAVNGSIYWADSSDSVIDASFIRDNYISTAASGSWNSSRNILDRNPADTNNLWTRYDSSRRIVASPLNDVAMTVLPNAPIDSATGLQVPTIAVATDGGVSIIKDDGTVVDLTYLSTNAISRFVDITSDGKIRYGSRSYSSTYNFFVFVYKNIPSADTSAAPDTTYTYTSSGSGPSGGGNGYYYLTTIRNGQTSPLADCVDIGDGEFVISTGSYSNGGQYGIHKIVEYDSFNSSSVPEPLVAIATTSFNTGWLHGNCKGAFLSDTDATNVTGTELVTNGDFASNSDWTAKGDTGLSISGGQATITLTTTNGQIHQNLPTLSAGTYVLSVERVGGTETNLYVTFQDATSGSTRYNLILESNISNGTYSATVTIPSTENNLRVAIYGYFWGGTHNGYTLIIDNVSLRLAEPDRSINAKGLQVFGTITKSAVATGAELVGYGPFSTSNYLRQPYNSALDFGTGNYSIILWINSPSINYDESIFLLGDYSLSTNSLSLLVLNSGGNGDSVQYTERGTSISLLVGPHENNQWTQLAFVRSGTTVSAYKNGVFQSSVSNTSPNNINFSSATYKDLIIGAGSHGGSIAFPYSGRISLFRISASAPSPEQIKKIYEDEKMLFQENAACTLYGSSDAVTALAYDEVTDRLHVGTSSGRSDFQGLRRINNTTTAVTTAISAHDEFIVEQ